MGSKTQCRMCSLKCEKKRKLSNGGSDTAKKQKIGTGLSLKTRSGTDGNRSRIETSATGALSTSGQDTTIFEQPGVTTMANAASPHASKILTSFGGFQQLDPVAILGQEQSDTPTIELIAPCHSAATLEELWAFSESSKYKTMVDREGNKVSVENRFPTDSAFSHSNY